MGKIIVYNTKINDFSNQKNNFYCGRHRNKDTKRNDNPLGNPFTHNGVKTNIASLSFKTREDAIKAFGEYFDKAYGVDDELTAASMV